MVGVSWYRFRSSVRQRWRGYVSLIILIGAIGGIAMAAIAGGRRTQSSYPAFAASTNPSDLTVSMYDAATGTPVEDLAAKIGRVPGVKRVRTVVYPIVARIGADGAAGPNMLVAVFGSSDGEFLAQDRYKVVRGRAADPGRADEVVMDASAARSLGVHVGDGIPAGLYSPEQEALPGFKTPSVPPLARVDVRVVGIVATANNLVQDDIDRVYGAVYVTPAFVQKMAAVVPVEARPVVYAVQLQGGSGAVPAAERHIMQLAPANALTQFHMTSRVLAEVELSLRPQALAVGSFGAIAGLVCLLLGVQAIARQVRLEDQDRQVMRYVGASTAMTTAESLVGGVGSVVVGALLAVVVALVLSPIAPLGPVRPVYPHRGIAFDWTVMGGGLLLLVGVLTGAAFVLVWRGAPHRAGRRRRAPAGSSRLARSAQAAGLPLAPVVGLRFALEPGDRKSVSTRSQLFGAIVAIGLVVTTLVFASSLQTLVSHPALYGWNWSYMLDPANDVPPSALALLDADRNVAAWSGVDYNIFNLDGLAVPAIMARPGEGGLVAPPILSGHGLRASNQIVIGSATLTLLHKRVGDTVRLSYGTSVNAPAYLAPTPLVIAGTATFPAVGFESLVADHTSMGTGAYFSESVFPPAFQQAVSNADPVLGGPGLVFIKMRAGLGAAAARADVQRIADAADKTLAADPNASGYLGGGVQVLGVQRPAQIVDYRTIGRTPLALAVGLAAGAVIALAMTLLASVRNRRRDLAILKAFGVTPRQLAATVAWQATVAAAAGAVVGIPLGIAVGRELWIIFARTLDAVPHPSVPIASVVVVAFGAFALANLVAIVPGQAARRTATATSLRTE